MAAVAPLLAPDSLYQSLTTQQAIQALLENQHTPELGPGKMHWYQLYTSQAQRIGGSERLSDNIYCQARNGPRQNCLRKFAWVAKISQQGHAQS